MTFTLWSRGRLLGETALDFECPFPCMRAGELQVTELGLRLLSRVTETRGDGLWAAQALNTNTPDSGMAEEERQRLLEVCADLAAARNYQRALELELRRADGSVVPVEQIDINDTEFLRAFSEAFEKELDGIPGVDASVDEPSSPTPWSEDEALLHDLEILEAEDDSSAEAREFARFQLVVTLYDEAVLPRA